MPEQDPDEATEHPTQPDAAAEVPTDEVDRTVADGAADDETASASDADAGGEREAEVSDEAPAVDEAAEPDEPAAPDEADEPEPADEPKKPDETAPNAAEPVAEQDSEEPAEADASESESQADVRDDDAASEPTAPGAATPPSDGPEAAEAEPTEADDPEGAEASGATTAEGPTDQTEPEQPTDDKAADDKATDDEPTAEPTQAKPTTGRQRLSDALFHFRRGQAIVAALLCVLGFAAVLQVRTNDQDNSYNGQREQDLIDILSGLAGTTQKAQEQLSALQRTRSDLESETNKQQAALDRSQQQVDTLRVMAGTTPVKGPGVNITVEPGPDELRLTPVLDLIEELRTNGAEAIDLNGKVRLVASTSVEVSQNVPGLVVEGQLVRPPYKFHVIGAPETLKGAIDFFRGPKDELEGEGAKVHLTTSENIEITSVHTPSH